MQVFGDRSSGNCYKVELMCSILKIDHDWVDIDVLAGETQKTIFRKLNPNGKIPLVTLHDGNTLAESNAILGFLAEGTPWMPAAGIARAKTYEWLFLNNIATNPISQLRVLSSITKTCLPNVSQSISSVKLMEHTR